MRTYTCMCWMTALDVLNKKLTISGSWPTTYMWPIEYYSSIRSTHWLITVISDANHFVRVAKTNVKREIWWMVIGQWTNAVLLEFLADILRDRIELESLKIGWTEDRWKLERLTGGRHAGRWHLPISSLEGVPGKWWNRRIWKIVRLSRTLTFTSDFNCDPVQVIGLCEKAATS